MALIDQDKQYWEKNIKHPNLTTKAFSSVTRGLTLEVALAGFLVND